jgi:uncharacterized protein YhfF
VTDQQPLPRPDEQSVGDLWTAYRMTQSRIGNSAVPEQPPVAESFGDSPVLADELLDLVLSGTKRATAALVVEFEYESEPLPRIGSHWIACDGAGRARAVLRSRQLRVGPVHSVDAAFAWDEGEGDRTLDDWLRGHRSYFRRRCAQLGIAYSDDLEAVFERFTVVWPPDLADDD